MNKIILTGHLTRDVDYRTNETGLTISKFCLANNDGYGEKKRVSFIDVVAFGSKADAISKYFSKGKAIMIEGRIKQETWTGKDGTKKSKLVVMLDQFEFMGSVVSKSCEGVDEEGVVEQYSDGSEVCDEVPF